MIHVSWRNINTAGTKRSNKWVIRERRCDPERLALASKQQRQVLCFKTVPKHLHRDRMQERGRENIPLWAGDGSALAGPNSESLQSTLKLTTTASEHGEPYVAAPPGITWGAVHFINSQHRWKTESEALTYKYEAVPDRPAAATLCPDR